MTRDDFSILWKMLVGIWPRLDTDETTAAWWGLLGHYPSHHATAALRHWSIERRTAPTPADIIAGIKAVVLETQREQRRPMLNAGECGDCENSGFVWVSFSGQGTVARCPKGCQSPLAGERTYLPESKQKPLRDPLEALETMRMGLAKRRRDLGHDNYLRERGRDPKYYRIQDGIILLRPEFA